MKRLLFSQRLLVFTLIIFSSIQAYAGCDGCCDDLRYTKNPYNPQFDECTGEFSFAVRTTSDDGGPGSTIVNYYLVEFTYADSPYGWQKLVEFNDNSLANTGEVSSGAYYYSDAGADWVHHARYQYNVSLTQEDEGNWGGALVEWKVPTDILNNGGLRLRTSRESKGISAGGNCSNYDGQEITDLSTIIPIYGAPTGLTATNNTNCNGVVLSWVNAAGINTCLNEERYTLIERSSDGGVNWSRLATPSPPLNQNTYTDNTAISGVSYNYKVATHVYYGGGRESFGNYSSVVIGKRKGAPETPFITSITTDRCDSSIAVLWETSNTADSYNISWSNGSSTGNASQTFANYTINGITGLGDYYAVTVNAVNECGISNESPAQGRALPKPDAVNDLSITELPSGFLQLTWSDVNFEDSYTIEKTANGSSAGSITLSANATSYLDTNVIECREYGYIIKAINECYTN
ncbi:MAG: hypothetical protein ACPG4Z_08085, partial [Chitinophagales bacterium]